MTIDPTNTIEHSLDQQAPTRSVEGEFPLHRERTTMSALCAAAVDDVRARFQDRAIEYVPDADRVGAGEWDPARLQYAVTVLLEDAAKRSDGSAAVSLRWREYDGEVVLRVQFPRPLSQGDRFVTYFENGVQPDGADDKVGTLRLVVARKILLQHGGQLARVRTHSGTCYVATLPRDGAAAQHPEDDLGLE